MQNVFSIKFKLKMGIKIDTFFVVSLSVDVFHPLGLPLSETVVSYVCFPGQTHMDIPPKSFEHQQEQQQTPLSSASGCSAQSCWASRHPETPPSGPVAELSVGDRQSCFPRPASLILAWEGSE